MLLGLGLGLGGGDVHERQFGRTVCLRIDFMVVGNGTVVIDEYAEWGVSDHTMLEGKVVVDMSTLVVDYCMCVD